MLQGRDAKNVSDFTTWRQETGNRHAPRILFSSVFKPYTQDDVFGSRTINPMELFHNQVTRAQGAFSVRMHHRSYGLIMMQENLEAPSVVLDFPTRERFRKEVRKGNYDIIGISGIVCNVGKVKEMCRIARKFAPKAKIIVGGHVAAIPNLASMIEADHIVTGEGIAWMRAYLEEDTAKPIRHPVLNASFGFHLMGLPVHLLQRGSGVIIPSVGCPLGCNFCATSAFFGGKGAHFAFLPTGRDIFNAMCEVERKLGTKNFFIQDENFLLHRKRIMELFDLMKAHGKSWEFYVFASANAISKYRIEELIEIGILWIWMGLESTAGDYKKLNGIDTRELIRKLQAHGIVVNGSTIIGKEHHTPQNIRDEIEHAISHDCVYHQFMLYTPLPGTPLWVDMSKQGLLVPNADFADIHGQDRFNFKHPAITAEQSKKFLDLAFEMDFKRNGPSIYRLFKTLFTGYERYRHHPDPRIRERYARYKKPMNFFYVAVLHAAEQYYHHHDPQMYRRIRDLRRDMHHVFGVSSWLSMLALGPVFNHLFQRERKQLARGKVYEPRTFFERKQPA